MRRKIANPRFPHYCRIYSKVEETAFDDGSEVTVYEGDCRFYSSESLRAFYETSQAGRVIKAECGLNLPLGNGVVEIKSGMLVDCETINEAQRGLIIREASVGNLGCSLYLSFSKN